MMEQPPVEEKKKRGRPRKNVTSREVLIDREVRRRFKEAASKSDSLLPTKKQMEVVLSVKAIRDLLEREGRMLVASAPAARELINATIESANDSLSEPVAARTKDNYRMVEAKRANDLKLISIASDNSKLVLQTSGLLPTNMTNTVINQVMIASEKVLAPAIAKLIGAQMDDSAEVIDITPEDPFGEETAEE